MGHHRKRHAYTFKNFKHDFQHDISKPISHSVAITERNVAGVYKSGFNALGKFGGGLGIITPIIIILGGGVAIYVISRQ